MPPDCLQPIHTPCFLKLYKNMSISLREPIHQISGISKDLPFCHKNPTSYISFKLQCAIISHERFKHQNARQKHTER